MELKFEIRNSYSNAICNRLKLKKKNGYFRSLASSIDDVGRLVPVALWLKQKCPQMSNEMRLWIIMVSRGCFIVDPLFVPQQVTKKLEEEEEE